MFLVSMKLVLGVANLHRKLRQNQGLPVERNMSKVQDLLLKVAILMLRSLELVEKLIVWNSSPYFVSNLI